MSGSQKTLCFGDDFGKAETMVRKFNPPLHAFLSLPVYATSAHSFSKQFPHPHQHPQYLPAGGARGLSTTSFPLLRGEGRPGTEVLRRYGSDVCPLWLCHCTVVIIILPSSSLGYDKGKKQVYIRCYYYYILVTVNMCWCNVM